MRISKIILVISGFLIIYSFFYLDEVKAEYINNTLDLCYGGNCNDAGPDAQLFAIFSNSNGAMIWTNFSKTGNISTIDYNISTNPQILNASIWICETSQFTNLTCVSTDTKLWEVNTSNMPTTAGSLFTFNESSRLVTNYTIHKDKIYKIKLAGIGEGSSTFGYVNSSGLNLPFGNDVNNVQSCNVNSNGSGEGTGCGASKQRGVKMSLLISSSSPKWSDNQSTIYTVYSPLKSNFNITWKNTVIDTVYFESNLTGTRANYTMSLISGNTTNGVWNFNASYSVGNFYWKSYANSNGNIWNNTDTWTFTINKSTSSITLYLNGTNDNKTYGPPLPQGTNFTAISNVTGLTVNISVNMTGLENTTLLDDSFEGGDTSDWILSGASATTITKYAGSYSLNLDVTDSAKNITADLTNCNNIYWDFWVNDSSTEAGDDLEIIYYNGTANITVDNILGNSAQENTWRYKSYNLTSYGAGAGTYILFNGSMSATTDDFFVDVVQLKCATRITWVNPQGTTSIENTSKIVTGGNYNITGFTNGNENYTSSSQTFFAFARIIRFQNITLDINLIENPLSEIKSRRDIINTVGLTEIVEKIRTVPKQLIQILDLSETKIRIISFVRSLTNTIDLTDVITRLRTIPKSITEALNLDDVIRKLSSFTKSLTNIIDLTDVITRLRTIPKLITEALNLDDVITRFLIRTRFITNSINLTDIITRLLSFTRNLINSINVSILPSIKTTKLGPLWSVSINTTSPKPAGGVLISANWTPHKSGILIDTAILSTNETGTHVNKTVYNSPIRYNNTVNFYKENEIPVTTTNTSSVLTLNQKFDPLINDSFLIIGSAEYKHGGSTTNIKGDFRENGNILGSFIEEPQESSNINNFITHTIKNLTISNNLMEYYINSSSGSVTAEIDNQRMFEIRVKDYFTNTSNASILTFTPSIAGNYIILATTEVSGSSIAFSVTVNLTVDEVRFNGVTWKPNDVVNVLPVGFVNMTYFDTSTHTIRLEAGGSSNKVENSRISVIRTGAISSNVFSNYTITSSAPGGSSVNSSLLTFTVPETNNYLIIAGGTTKISSGDSLDNILINLSIDGTSYNEYFLASQQDVTNINPFVFAKNISFGAGQHKIYLTTTTHAGETVDTYNTTIIAFELLANPNSVVPNKVLNPNFDENVNHWIQKGGGIVNVSNAFADNNYSLHVFRAAGFNSEWATQKINLTENLDIDDFEMSFVVNFTLAGDASAVRVQFNNNTNEVAEKDWSSWLPSTSKFGGSEIWANSTSECKIGYLLGGRKNITLDIYNFLHNLDPECSISLSSSAISSINMINITLIAISNFGEGNRVYMDTVNLNGGTSISTAQSNFTWSNSSVADGTTVEWKIYANDTDGNENVTSLNTFTITSLLFSRNLTNSITLSNIMTRIFTPLRQVTNTIDITDVIGRILSLLRQITNTIDLTEIITRIRTVPRELTNIIDLNEITRRTISLIRSLINTIDLTDAIKRIRLVPRTLTNTINLTDIITKISSFRRNLNNSINLAETVTRISNLLRELTNTIDLTDKITRLTSFKRSLTNTIDLIDTVQRILSSLRQLTQALNLTEIITRITLFTRSITNVIDLTEIITRIRTVPRTIAEAINLSELTTRIASFARQLANAVDLTDKTTRIISFKRSLTNTIDFIDVIQRIFTPLRRLINTIDLTEAKTKTFSSLRQLTNTIDLAEIVIRVRTVPRQLTQALNLTEIITRITLFTRSITNVIDLTEIITRIRTVPRTIAEAINLSELTTRIASFARLLTNTIDLAETISRLAFFPRKLINSIDLNESVTRIISFARSLINIIDLTDLVERIRTVPRTISQILDLTDTLSRLGTFTRTLANAIDLSDIITRMISFTRNLTNSISLIENIIAEFGERFPRSVTQNLNLAENIESIHKRVRLLINTISFNDTFIRIASLTRSLTNSIDLTELMERIRRVPRELINSIDLTERTTRTFKLLKQLVNTINVADATTRIVSFIRPLTNIVDLTELIKRIMTVSREMVELLNITELITKISSFTRSLINPINLTEAITRIFLPLRQLTNAIDLTDTTTRLTSFTKNIVNNVNLTETITRLVSFTRNLTNTIDLTELVERIKRVPRAVTEALDITEAITKLTSFTRSLNNVISLINELNLPGGLAKFTRSLINELNLTDLTTRIYTSLRQVTNTINITDLIKKTTTIFRTLTNTIDLTDLIERIRNVPRVLTEAINLSELTTRLIPFTRSLINAIDLTDVTTRIASFTRPLTNSIDITDAIARILSFLRKLTNIINLANPLTTKGITAPILQSIGYQIGNISGTATYILTANFTDNDINFWYFGGLGTQTRFTNSTLELSLGSPSMPITANLTLNDTGNTSTRYNASLNFNLGYSHNTTEPANTTYQVVTANMTFNPLSQALNLTFFMRKLSGATTNITNVNGTVTNMASATIRYGNWYGDWIENETKNDTTTLYSTEALVRTSAHTQNITGYYNISAGNNNTLVNLSITLNSTVPSTWSNTTTTSPSMLVRNGTGNTTRVNLTLDAVYEDQFIETFQTGVGNQIKNTYISYIIVRENTSTKTIPIKYKIPKSRIPNYDNYVSNPNVSSTINGTSAGVTVIGEEETGYVSILVSTSHSTSSLSQGTHDWRLIYYTPKPVGPGGEGGGGGGGAPTPIEENITENITEEQILPILFDVFPETFNLNLTPGVSKTIFVTVLNNEKENIAISIDFQGNTEIAESNFTVTNLESGKSLDIPVKITAPTEILNKKVILQIKAKKGLITAVKEVPIYLGVVKIKNVGEECISDIECSTGLCGERNGRLVCMQVEKKEKEKPLRINFTIIFIVIMIGVGSYLVYLVFFQTNTRKT